MQYMGSKARHAKEILPIILKDRKEGQFYYEPFVGGANMIDKVSCPRVGADSNIDLITLLVAVQNGWEAPEDITEEEYREAKGLVLEVSPRRSFIGFLCSFGSKWFGGYARAKDGKNYAAIGHRSLKKQAPNLQGVDFRICDFEELYVRPDSIIYCDPPYANTTKYATGNFDHDRFWTWCDKMVGEGHKVFVSEYAAPEGWVCVWQKIADNKINFGTGSSQAIEKLFTKVI